MLPFRKVLCPPTSRRPRSRGVSGARSSAPLPRLLCLAHVVAGLPDAAPDLNYTFRVPEYEAALKADASAKLSALASRLGGEGVQTDYVVGHGTPARDRAHSPRVGRRRHHHRHARPDGSPRTLRVGRRTRVAAARCPVITVRSHSLTAAASSQSVLHRRWFSASEPRRCGSEDERRDHRGDVDPESQRLAGLSSG